MRKMYIIFALTICIVANAQQRRVALIIGNEEYSGHFSTLHTSISDADAMHYVLNKLGFETIVGKNVMRDSMSIYLNKFRKLANGAEMALFYFSGHAGIDNKGQYYLAPSGIYNSVATLIEDCYSFSSVEREVKSIGAPVRFLIIDACRNSIGDSKGKITSFSPEAIKDNLIRTKGTIYWFATGVNKTAQTGVGKYSLFTESVLNHIGDKDNLDLVWKRISDEVARANYEQVPFRDETVNGLSSKIYLNPKNIKIYPINTEGKDYYTISTIPTNATISVNGKVLKNKDSFILNYGVEYDVNISAEGYSTYNDKITATPFKTTYHFSLDTLAKAKVDIRSNISGATVYFDDENKGISPVNIETYSGIHNIRIERKGYHSYNARPVLQAGSQTHYAKLSRYYPWFWDWDDVDSPAHSIYYVYSPKYQIGFEYLGRFKDSRFLLGGYAATSWGLFKGIKVVDATASAHAEASSSVTVNNTTINNTTENSKEADTYNETTDVNILFMLTGGYQPCNGLMVEASLGAASHWDKIIIDDESHWGKPNKWSPAMRIGLKTFIPINNDKDWFISIGGGYTYLFSNNKYSSWDASIGIAWSL